ncbi:hypothetical protein [Clostridium ihumii]|uniref:hypothetical protein n=1 Tax=Clostridium ihumii TaxID=1470356 RepID=UPI0005535AC0|nr:hypothetical protein [Clostridium ihumii]
MVIFSKKSFKFINGTEEANIRNQEMKEMPDWIEGTLLFKLAKEDDSISVIENRKQLKAVENGEKKNNNEQEKTLTESNEDKPEAKGKGKDKK